MSEKAPTCPISHSQDPSNPHGISRNAPTRLPAIPIATDLPSLIRSVNIMLDVLRTLTTSLTVNNTYLPRAPRKPKVYGDKNYTISPYPDWYQVEYDNVSGYVGKDPKARANVERLNTVVFRNNERGDDNLFKWNYRVPLSGEGGGNEPFEEDFFERIVKVKWKKTEVKGFSATWFWSCWIHGVNGTVEPFCEPWELAPANTSALVPANEFTIAEQPKITLFGKRPTNYVLIGDPTGSASAHSENHSNGGLMFGQKPINIIGETITVPINANRITHAACWGQPSYEEVHSPGFIWSYWSAYCKCWLRNEREDIGSCTINASGISATTLDGKPLKKVRTEMSASGSGGAVVVTFSDEDT